MNAGFVECKEEPVTGVTQATNPDSQWTLPENVVNVHLSCATLHMACLLQHPIDALSNRNVVFRHLRIRH